MKISLPLYQHPTQVILVDDSASFIASLEFQMHPMLAVKSFDGSVEALRWIFAAYREHHDEQARFPEGAVLPQNTADGGTHGRPDISHICRMVKEPKRFLAPAVVVVDYAMPYIDGLDFCRALEGLPCKKILFTGEADEMVAVDAFNRGLIDRYLKKGDPDALDRLSVEIAALERQFFVERSAALKNLLARSAYSFLSDDTFVRLVYGLIKRHGFVEHYLFPDPSGILFFNAEGKAMLMVVETRVGLNSHLETAQDYGAPEDLQEALRRHRVVPFFWSSGGMYTEKVLNWQQYCLPACVCEGREDFFWAMFELPTGFLSEPVYAYGEFLKDQRIATLE